MKKKIIFLGLLLISAFVFAKEYKVSVKITNVIPDGGKVIIGIYNSKEEFESQKSPKDIIIEPADSILEWSYMMEEGEHLISAYQDVNGNGHMDYNVVRMPKEPYGFTNYTSKTIPSYKKLKFNLDSDMELEIPLL